MSVECLDLHRLFSSQVECLSSLIKLGQTTTSFSLTNIDNSLFEDEDLYFTCIIE